MARDDGFAGSMASFTGPYGQSTRWWKDRMGWNIVS